MSDKYAALKQAAKPYLWFGTVSLNTYGGKDGDESRIPLYAEIPVVPNCFVEFYKVIRDRHHGRMPQEVQEAFNECTAFLKSNNPATILELLAERDALREGEMGDAKHSNTRAAADIYFQLVEECEIPAGGSLVEHIDDMRERLAELEARTLTVKLPDDGMDDCYDIWGPEHCRNNFDCGYNFSAVRHEEAIREACAAAGISLKIEGE